ncbi:MAG: site-specific DNA-methyltransferase [Methylococcales bacterium]|nr:site-specific DNA-methyltransferase [Methylococcales bacterium]
MIYIDPPYNTGNDSFVYPDDYSERQSDYKKRVGITNEEGFLNKQDLWKKNTKESGQFHSVWLSMMYPRLYLARNLLREDGVIFVSIDENEVSNLKLLLDEVFGSENFIGQIANINNPKGRSDDKFIAIAHEYTLNGQVLGFFRKQLELHGH